MNFLSKHFWPVLLFLPLAIPAQKKVVLEKIRFQSFNTPLRIHIQKEEVKKSIAVQLNQTLLKYQHLPLADTSTIETELLSEMAQIRAVKPEFTSTDTTQLHLYIDFFEAPPAPFFAIPENSPPDSDIIKRAVTIFIVNAWLVNGYKKIVFSENVNIIVSQAETPGMGTYYGRGIQYGDLTITPKSFIDLLKSTANLLFDPNNNMAQVEIKILPAFLADNYILPKTVKLPRIYVSSKKGVSNYRYQQKSELIRQAEPVYEEIMLKGKKPETYPEQLTNAIKNTAHFASSDFVFLRQECRDVARDKNYLIKLTTQVDPENLSFGMDKNLLFTHFLPGPFHCLLLEKDTVAIFEIAKNQPDPDKKIYPGLISNGFDSVLYKIPNTRIQEWPIEYQYVISGKLNNKPFRIKCSGGKSTVKEFFFNEELVCIAQGKFMPEKFVIFDASLSPEILNQLFFIGFNRFLE